MRFSKPYPFLFSCCASFLAILAAAPDVDASLDSNVTAAECIMGVSALGLDLTKLHYYDEWFRPESKMVLPQAGEYFGPKDMAEYFAFATPSSPYVLERDDLVHAPPRLKYIRDGICTFTTHGTIRFVLSPENASDTTLLASPMIKLNYNFKENYISEVYVHFKDEFYESVFGTWLNTDGARRTICDTSVNRCPDTNVGMSREECMQKLKEIPTFTNGTQFDGYDFGCRALHAVLAEFDDKHCPHISFEPQLDKKNKYKCQESSFLRSTDFFDEDDFQTYEEFLESKESLIESATGFKILYQAPEYSTRHYILVGLVAPLVIFLTVFFVAQKAQPTESEDEKESNPLFANKLEQFRIILGTLLASLFIINGVAGAIIWALAGIHPEWVRREVENKLEDTYRGENGLVVLESVPHELLTDSQFRIYAGFVVWATVLIAGLGLEIFVWYHFLQFWSNTREALWRFSQFIFPLLLVTSLGLALHRNFLALPILVVGLWKFGFPETLMFFYLGIFNTSKSRMRRASDFLNGVGTVTHHGAASFVISMLCIGVAPASRYILNCCLILVMQHWVALLAYANVPLYSAIELTLEFWFEWIILADFPQIYYLHWTMALGAGVMIFAHWLYLIAAGLDMFADEPTKEEDNVHKRGQNVIASSLTKASSNPSNPIVPNAQDESLVFTRRGSSLSLRGLTRQGSTLGTLNRQESASILQGLSSQGDNSKMPMSVRLADSFLQLQVESHLSDLKDVNEDEEMIEFIKSSS